jgi:multisubunit Na+/H+ antiporter MnhB subunit
VSEQVVAGLMLITVPILFNAGFTLLAQRFDYPDILRRPTHEVLERFRAGGTGLILIWWLFSLSAVLFATLSVLLAIASTTPSEPWSFLGWWRACSPRSSSSLALSAGRS